MKKENNPGRKDIWALVALLAAAAIMGCVLLFGGLPNTGGTDPTGEPTVGTEATVDTGGNEETEGTEETEEVTEPDATGEGTEPEETEGTETEATGAGETEPDGSEPVTEPEETEPDATGNEGTEPDATEETEPIGTDVGATEPDETEHVHNHDITIEEVKPTCTEEGYTITACPCGHNSGVGYAALGHDWSSWVVIVEPTVTSTGVRERTCSRCGTVTEVIPALDPETSEAYEAYIDPRIVIKKYRTSTRYRYENVSVLDGRTWGEAPSIWINDDGSLTVVYFHEDGSRVEVCVDVPPAEYNNCCVIMDDGSYMLTLTGSYGEN